MTDNFSRSTKIWLFCLITWNNHLLFSSDTNDFHSDEAIQKARASAEGLVHTSDYVHRWIPYPGLTSRYLNSKLPGPSFSYGTAEVTFFIASWCVPCQNLMGKLKSLKQTFERYDIRFTFVFAHDLKADAIAFMKEYGIKDGILSNEKILESFNNPQLPSVYVSDRLGWLIYRKVRTRSSDITEIDGFLHYLSLL